MHSSTSDAKPYTTFTSPEKDEQASNLLKKEVRGDIRCFHLCDLQHYCLVQTNVGEKSDDQQNIKVEDQKDDWQKTNSTRGWKHCVKTMTVYDEKLVEGWKDELSNILIFVRHLSI